MFPAPAVGSTSIQDYLANGKKAIGGWFAELDALLFVTIDEIQRERHITGDLLEIGVYLGKSAILLGFFAREGEEVVVCDIFRDPSHVDPAEESRYLGLTEAAFRQNYARFHKASPVVHVKPSSQLMTDTSLPPAHRFLHVDGSHEFAAVAGDVALAVRQLLPGGVVAFDDISTLHAIGVARAVWGAVERGELVSFAATPDKLYATRPSDAQDWTNDLRRRLAQDRAFSVADHELGGSTILTVTHRPRRSMIDRAWEGLAPPALRKRLETASRRIRER